MHYNIVCVVFRQYVLSNCLLIQVLFSFILTEFRKQSRYLLTTLYLSRIENKMKVEATAFEEHI